MTDDQVKSLIEAGYKQWLVIVLLLFFYKDGFDIK